MDSRKLAQMRGIGIEWAKKIIMVAAQNSSRDVMTPITKRFWMRQAMFRRQRFRGMEYTNTMIAGVKYVYGNRFAQLYETGFGGVIIYLLAHRRETHNLLSHSFVYSEVPEHLHSDNSWEVANSINWNKVLYDKGRINISQTEPHSQFHNKAK